MLTQLFDFAQRVPMPLPPQGIGEPLLIEAREKLLTAARWTTWRIHRQRDQHRGDAPVVGMGSRVDHGHEAVIERGGIPAPAIVGLLRIDRDAPDAEQMRGGDELRRRLLTPLQIEENHLHPKAHRDRRQPQQGHRLAIAWLTHHRPVPPHLLERQTQLTAAHPLVEISTRKGPSGSVGGGETREIWLEGEDRSAGDGEGEADVECGGVAMSGRALAEEWSGETLPAFPRRGTRERASQRTRLVRGCSHSRTSAQVGAKQRWSSQSSPTARRPATRMLSWRSTNSVWKREGRGWAIQVSAA